MAKKSIPGFYEAKKMLKVAWDKVVTGTWLLGSVFFQIVDVIAKLIGAALHAAGSVYNYATALTNTIVAGLVALGGLIIRGGEYLWEKWRNWSQLRQEKNTAKEAMAKVSS